MSSELFVPHRGAASDGRKPARPLPEALNGAKEAPKQSGPAASPPTSYRWNPADLDLLD